jgi:hypothetical protein
VADHIWALREGDDLLASGTMHGTARQREKNVDEVQSMVRYLIEEYIVDALSDTRVHSMTFTVERFPSGNGVAKRQELTEVDSGIS